MALPVLVLIAAVGAILTWRLRAAVWTRLERAEAASEASEERYQAVVELTSAGVWTTDPDGRTTSVDRGVCKMLGYRPEEMQGRPLSDFYARQAKSNGSNHEAAANGAAAHGEVELRRRSGKAIGVLLSSKPLRNVGGEGSGTLTLVTEAAGRKKAEAETELLKNEFFALISHELRTPLTSMVGYLDLIAQTQNKRMTQEGRDFIDVINRNTTRLSTLLEDLMLLTQVEAGTFAIKCDQVNLTGLAASSIEEARPAAESAGIELALAPGEPVGCWADANRIGQVLDNLILNATKFTPSGGHVEVRILERGQDAVIEVADDGPGIPAAEHKQMFNRFYRGAGARAMHVQGLGLGLAIAKAIVDAHSGELGLASKTGIGTTFTVELPRRRPKPGSLRWVRTSAVRKSRVAAAN